MRHRTVLVIDDERIWRDLLTKFFSIFSYTVFTAATCEEGNRLAGAERPDCIVVDWNLTDGTAFEVCAFIRSEADLAKTPIIVFSSDPNMEPDAYEKCKADKFFLKGTSLFKIVADMESLIQSAR